MSPRAANHKGGIAVHLSGPVGVSAATVRAWASRSRRLLGREQGDLSVAFVRPAAMRKLNRQWRGKDKPTNVLSFLLDEGKKGTIWGEIFLCAPVIRREAKEQGRVYRQYVKLLLDHGLIHLLGLDHEQKKDERRWRLMEKKLGYTS